ncbi:hypothetical protein N7520_005317 [Penicillium odoratum]|uniref:uncharacterized protein n=1 Tax=Penicillium odoratum TaxID=1167516 RepID=UPI0025482F51|nr:uncharacterized protein N7520_005317 [Penicillium odoratum]KAJ5765758.1 hypothetical protein N7520_005317 [Penicillium odoratum]
MASDALTDLERARKEMQKIYFGGKASNQFVDEIKNAALFQFSWGELLSAAPTALSLMGSLWIAASSETAGKIMLDSQPTGGFKYLVNRKDMSLRSCLVEVAVARLSQSLAGTWTHCKTAVVESRQRRQINIVFARLVPCTRGKYELEDFMDALQDFSEEAKQCATLATEIRMAFNKWGKMVGELHACLEQESTNTSLKQDIVKVDALVAIIDKKFATAAVEDSKLQAEAMQKQVQRAEKRLDNALDNLPGPWAQVAQAAVSGFAQALPYVMGGILPAVLAAANPAKPNNNNAQTTDSAASSPAITAADPAYAAALEMKDFTAHFYENLGGEKGEINLEKFRGSDKPTDDADGAQSDNSSIGYLIGTLTNQQNSIEKTNTEPNKKLHASLNRLIKVANDIRTLLGKGSSINSEKLDPKTVNEWKSEVKTAMNDLLALSSSAVTMSSINSPELIKIDISKPDHSAQVAQVNSAMQAVQMTQSAVEAAQKNYDAALARQANTAAAMAEVEKRLERLKESAITLEEIKAVLRDCINVLVDLSVQFGKLERFFTMLTTVIDHVMLPRAQSFVKGMSKAGERANERGLVNVDDISKQIIYTSTLQVKAYFSLLEDISGMYSQVDRHYIADGVNLCYKLSESAASNEPMEEFQAELKKYSEDSSKKVAQIVDEKQKEILNGLRARAEKALQSTLILEDTIKQRGIIISDESKSAIRAGAEAAKAKAKELLNQEQCATGGTEDMALDEL